MATTVSYNGTNYTVPQSGDSGWGTTLTTYLVALASGSLTKAGGLMTLTAELDLGATYGIKSAYFSARGTPATAGAYRLENNTSVSWRNAANDGNLNLTVNSSNALQFNSLPIVALALGAANTVLKMNSGGTAFEYGTLVNANINASAAIDGSKIVSASASVPGVITTGTQSFGGNKTFEGTVNLGTPNTAITGVTAHHSSTTSTGAVQLSQVSSDTKGAWLYLTKARAAESITQENDQVGAVYFYAKGASAAATHVASMQAYIDAEPGTAGDTTDTPGRLAFFTSLDGASGQIECFRIDSKSNVIVQGSGVSSTSITHGTQGLVLRNNDTVLATGDYIPPIRFEVVDSSLTTTNPKTVAWIAAKVVDSYNVDTASGAQLEFATSPEAGGASVTPTVRMTIANDGAVTLGDLAGTGTRMVTADATGVLAAATIVESGTYTPTFTLNNATGGTAAPFNYMRVGNIVFVTGHVHSITVTTTGVDVDVVVSVPVATASFSGSYQVSGTMKLGRSSGGNECGSVFSSSDKALGRIESTSLPSSSGNVIASFSFSYEIQ